MVKRTTVVVLGAVAAAAGIVLLLPRAVASNLASGTVTVLAPGGAPVAGAVVSIGSFSAVTNAAGVATFSNIPQPATYTFTITTAGFPTYNANLNFSGASSTFSFQITLA